MRAAFVIRSDARDRTGVNSLVAYRRDELAVLLSMMDIILVSNLRTLTSSLPEIEMAQLPHKPVALSTTVWDPEGL